MKYSLIVYCNNIGLSNDKCSNLTELKDTFVEVYNHYIGHKPKCNLEKNFIKEKNCTYYDNGLFYSFSYFVY